MDRFEKRVISGREIINPFRTENSKEFLSNNLEHEVKTIIDRLFWIEEENKKLEEENERLLVLLEKCWNEFTEIEHVAGIAPDKELYNAVWKEINK